MDSDNQAFVWVVGFICFVITIGMCSGSCSCNRQKTESIRQSLPIDEQFEHLDQKLDKVLDLLTEQSN